MANRLIGIGNRKQQGKDTLAKLLMEFDDFKIRAFAQSLKNFAVDTFGLSYSQAHGTNEQKNTMTRISTYDLGLDLDPDRRDLLTARQVLQQLGVRMREMFPQIWVNAPFRARGPNEATLLTDLRFPDEFDRLVQEGGTTVRVTRPDHDLGDLHESETALDDIAFDIEVVNDGDMSDLRWAAAMVYALTSTPPTQRIQLSCKSRQVKVL